MATEIRVPTLGESVSEATIGRWFKKPGDMAALFADLPEAVENTVEIARRCAFAVARHKPILPRFAEDEVEELRRQAREGLAARLAGARSDAPAIILFGPLAGGKP